MPPDDAAMPPPGANYDSIEPTPVSDKSNAALTSANDSNGFSENPQPVSKVRDAVGLDHGFGRR
jgi:hypothetical protein